MIESLYPKTGRVGHQPIGVERMLRMYCVQQWFGLSDEGVEDSLFNSQALRRFVGIDLSRESAPAGGQQCDGGDVRRSDGGAKQECTRVDAKTIAAPPCTKNKDKTRHHEMHQTKKGNQRYFGIKAHTYRLLHGQECQVHLDAGHTGVQQRDEVIEAQAQARIAKDIEWNVATTLRKIKVMPAGELKGPVVVARRAKLQIRALVEHFFHDLKNLVHHKKARYKGLAMSEAQLYSLFDLVNLVIARS